MITKIGFENIRAFQNLTEFELKPLTILTGANNSGKSVLQKMLLLLSNGFQTVNNEIQLDKLSFKKELINKIGDFTSNVNYNNQNNQLVFSFQYEDEIFSLLNVELVFEGDDSRILAHLIKVTFSDIEGKLIELKKEKSFFASDDTNEIFWNWDYQLLNDYFNKLLDGLLEKRKESERDIALNNICCKLYEGSTLEELSALELEIYNSYKSLGIVANDPRAIEFFKKNILTASEKIGDTFIFKDYFNPHIFDDNTGQIWSPKNMEILKKFPPITEGSNFLIDTPLLKSIGNDYNTFLAENNPNFQDLKKELIANGITDSDRFEKEYRNFEIIALEHSFYHGYFTLEDDSITEFLNNRLYKKTTYSSLYQDHKENIIIMILNKFYNLEKGTILIDSTTLAKPFVKESVKGTDKVDVGSDAPDDFNVSVFKFTDYCQRPLITFMESLATFFQNITIISTNTQIKRQYLYSDFDTNDSVFLDFGLNYFNGIGSEIEFKKEFVNKWLQIYEIADELKVSKIKLENGQEEQYLGFYFSLIKNNQEFPLYDCGSGVHQIVLLLLNIVNCPNNKTFLLEEPETNMHPMFQSKIADLIVESKKIFDVNFIIETHSEYLIRKLQYLTAKKEIKPEDISLYYLNSEQYISAHEPKLKKIEITENGNLTENFGPGFFDETTKLQFGLMKINQ